MSKEVEKERQPEIRQEMGKLDVLSDELESLICTLEEELGPISSERVCKHDADNKMSSDIDLSAPIANELRTYVNKFIRVRDTIKRIRESLEI